MPATIVNGYRLTVKEAAALRDLRPVCAADPAAWREIAQVYLTTRHPNREALIRMASLGLLGPAGFEVRGEGPTLCVRPLRAAGAESGATAMSDQKHTDLLAACEDARELCITVLGEVQAENVRKWAEDVLAKVDAAVAMARGETREPNRRDTARGAP